MDLDNIDIPDDLLDAAEALNANPYLTDPAAGMGLLARLLAAPTTALTAMEPLARLRKLIHDEFENMMPFCGPYGLTATRELAAIATSIEELVLFPDLANKVVVGVGGGFSAGKSRFLNTLLGITMLPEGLGPTTAIPTCLASGASAVRAQNLMNRMVPVNAEELQALAHGFDRQYRGRDGNTFGLAHLIKLLVIQEPSIRWSNLTLLDTPGYDKPDGEAHSLSDEEIARQQLSQADHVVWLVNARNGTVRADDIRFLRSFKHQRPVFFVMTQADLQTTSALPGLLQDIENAAISAGIDCAGVMGWSAPQGVRHGHVAGGTDINQWLDNLDLQPRLTDKRRSASRLIDTLSIYLDEQLAAGREELALLNAFWPVAQQLASDTVDGMRQLLAGKRAIQREQAERVVRLKAFRHELDATLTTVLDTIFLADARSEEAIAQQYEEAMLSLRSRHGRGGDAASFSSLLDAACHDHMLAQYAVSECYRLGTGTEKDPMLAFNWCRKAALSGMAEAQYMLANYYLEGQGVGIDPAAALHWYQAAAEQEHLRAQMQLFTCFASDLDDNLNLPLAIDWLKRAAQQEFAEAQYELGKCYLAGIGVAKNGRTAGRWFYKAAEQGYALAQHATGQAYLADSDDAEAVHWFRLAAQQDLPEAQSDLARCYLDGTGVQVNRAHAASWYRKAERLGHVPATTGLGHCHFAAEEPELGVRCYRRAAELGDAEAQYRLGECYFDGDGVRKNRSLAMRWFDLAAEQNYALAHHAMDEESA